MLNYLETAAQKCKTTYMKAILLRFVLRYIPFFFSFFYMRLHSRQRNLFLTFDALTIRFQMDILRNESNEKKEQLLTNMLNTVTTAYTTTKDAQKKDHLLIGMSTKPDYLSQHYQLCLISRNQNLVCANCVESGTDCDQTISLFSPPSL